MFYDRHDQQKEYAYEVFLKAEYIKRHRYYLDTDSIRGYFVPDFAQLRIDDLVFNLFSFSITAYYHQTERLTYSVFRPDGYIIAKMREVCLSYDDKKLIQRCIMRQDAAALETAFVAPYTTWIKETAHD